MSQIKKLSYSLLLIGFCLLFILPAQSQSPRVGVTLTWSTDTYTPLNYQGKALPIRGSHIEVVANIDLNELNPDELVFYWFLDNKIQKADSGLGKQTFEFTIGQTISKSHLIRAEVQNREGTLLLSSNYLSISIQSPEIVIWPNLSRVSSNQEVAFTAQPYFFNIKDINELTYNWSFGQESASLVDSTDPNLFILKVGQVDQSITQELSISVENKNNPFQKARASTQINLIP